VIETWLSLPVWALLSTLALFLMGTAGLIYWCSFHGPSRTWIARFRDVEGPVFGAAALLFAMLTGFVASDVWQRNASAARLVAGESESLTALVDIARAGGLDNAALHARIRDYARVVVDEEWPSMGAGHAAPQANEALQALLHEVLDSRYAVGGGLVQRLAIDQVLKVREVRSRRLVLSGERTNELKWGAVIALSVLTQLAIALMHLDKPRPQVAALAVFSVAAFLGLGMVALQESPFEYPLQVSSDPIAQVLKIIPEGAPAPRAVPAG